MGHVPHVWQKKYTPLNSGHMGGGRDRILSLVTLAPGALHEELGEGEAQEMGTELKQGLKLGWVRVLLAPQPSSGSSCCSQAKVWSPLPCVWAPWCEAVSVCSTQRDLPFPFVNYI